MKYSKNQKCGEVDRPTGRRRAVSIGPSRHEPEIRLDATLITGKHLGLQRHLYENGGAAGGWKWAAQVMGLAETDRARTLLDYGAGNGSLAAALSERFNIHSYDPVTYPEAPAAADLVVCTDVLENVERACLDGVLDDLERLARQALYLVISVPSARQARPGLIIEPSDWWLPKLAKRWPRHNFEEDCRPWAERKPTARRLRFVWRREPRGRLSWLDRSTPPEVPLNLELFKKHGR